MCENIVNRNVSWAKGKAFILSIQRKEICWAIVEHHSKIDQPRQHPMPWWLRYFIFLTFFLATQSVMIKPESKPKMIETSSYMPFFFCWVKSSVTGERQFKIKSIMNISRRIFGRPWKLQSSFESRIVQIDEDSKARILWSFWGTKELIYMKWFLFLWFMEFWEGYCLFVRSHWFLLHMAVLTFGWSLQIEDV